MKVQGMTKCPECSKLTPYLFDMTSANTWSSFEYESDSGNSPFVKYNCVSNHDAEEVGKIDSVELKLLMTRCNYCNAPFGVRPTLTLTERVFEMKEKG